MTCIAGLVHEGKVYIGGDSAGVAGLDLIVRKAPKVFALGEFVIGFTTSFRMGQILQYAFTPPQRHPSKDVMAFMVTEFIAGIRQAFKDQGFATKNMEGEIGGEFLVGYQGRLFRIFSDYQVAENECGYDACGCGESYAQGVFFATPGMQPGDRVLLALSAAGSHSAGVRAPFHTLSM